MKKSFCQVSPLLQSQIHSFFFFLLSFDVVWYGKLNDVNLKSNVAICCLKILMR